MKKLLLCLAISLPAEAESRWRFLRHVSIGVVAGAHGADIASSYGRREMNPVLADRGRFTDRSVAIKSAVVAGWLIISERYFSEHDKAVTLTNFATGGAVAGVAVRNWRQK